MLRTFLVLSIHIGMSCAQKSYCNYKSHSKVLYCTNIASEEDLKTKMFKAFDDYRPSERNISVVVINNSTLDDLTFQSFDLLNDIEKLILKNSYINRTRRKAFENFKSLKVLVMNFDQITNIQYGILFGLSSLKTLKLSTLTTLTELPEGIFFEPIKLQTLDLSKNRLIKIERIDFSPLVGLLKLNISKNNITEISPGTFQDLGKLKVLDLSSNNIRDINETVFAGLKNLKHLFLNGNSIKEFEPCFICFLRNLEMLNMSKNKLRMLDDYSFEKLGKLRVLKLGNNKGLVIYSYAFVGLTSLEELDLSSCALIELPMDIFRWNSNLHKLNLRNNRLGKEVLEIPLIYDLKISNMVDLSKNTPVTTYNEDGLTEALENDYV